MKSQTFVRIKSIAVKIAIILLAIMWSMGIGSTLSSEPVSSKKVSTLTNITVSPYFEFSKGEQQMCTQLKEDIMREIARDKQKRTAFFQELRTYASDRMSLHVLDIVFDDTQVCISYTRKIKKKSFPEVKLARASRAGFFISDVERIK
jgi:hypothetical protein